MERDVGLWRTNWDETTIQLLCCITLQSSIFVDRKEASCLNSSHIRNLIRHRNRV
jgi:hypothetical protein